MVRINEQLISQYQNVINYNNADSMFNAFVRIIEENCREFILKREHDTEEDCVRSYGMRSAVMRFACDAIEHYAKAILIQNGHTWNESKSWGHNLLDLFNNLDDESRHMITCVFMPMNSVAINSLEKEYVLNNNKDDFLYFFHLMEKFCVFDVKKEDISNFYNNYDSYYYECYGQKILGKMSFIPRSEHIVALQDGQSVTDGLSSLIPTQVPGQPRQQLFGIKARFPGQYVVEGPAEFLISLAYAMNGLSKIYRKREESNRKK